jgi:hypothetical protein
MFKWPHKKVHSIWKKAIPKWPYLVHQGPNRTPHRKRIIRSAQLPKYLGPPMIDQLMVYPITTNTDLYRSTPVFGIHGQL